MAVDIKKPEAKADATEKVAEITRTPTVHKINIDPGLSFDEAIVWITKKRDEENQAVNFTDDIDAYPVDGAHALYQTLKAMFGWVDQPVWGGEKPQLRNVEIGYNQFTEIPWGKFSVPGVKAIMTTMGFKDRGVHKFRIQANVIRKDLPKVKEIVANTRSYLQEHSIYKGKVLRLEWNEGNFFDPAAFDIPKFIAPSGLRPEDLILPEDIYNEVDAGVFSLIQNYKEAREMGVQSKRLTIFAGPYGTGKTLATGIIAEICRGMGRTFIYLTDLSKLTEAVFFAKQYSPAFIVGEDIDRVMNPEVMEEISNTIDGVDTKQIDVMFALTTNHLDRISDKFLRHGRSDLIVEFTPPDGKAIGRLIMKYGRGLIDVTDDEAAALGAELAEVGMIPASIREVVERSKLFAIAKGRLVASAHDVKLASLGVARQVALLNRKPEGGLPAHLHPLGVLIAPNTDRKILNDAVSK